LFEKRRENMELVVLEQFESAFATCDVCFLYFRVDIWRKCDIGAMADLDLVGVFQDEWMRVHGGQIVADDEDDGASIIADFNQIGAS
jgi:hypothetical protein